MDETQLLDEIRRSLGSATPRSGKAERIADAIRRWGRYRWVGIYELDGDEIAVVGWSGPGEPAHPRFPATHGLCGAALASGAPVVVDDVTVDSRYLTTFGSTRSEIVVPIFETGEVVGLIDVESDAVAAFMDVDRSFLERCASALAPLLSA
jgi:L-methionine (R)-S-oxide reductase